MGQGILLVDAGVHVQIYRTTCTTGRQLDSTCIDTRHLEELRSYGRYQLSTCMQTRAYMYGTLIRGQQDSYICTGTTDRQIYYVKQLRSYAVPWWCRRTNININKHSKTYVQIQIYMQIETFSICMYTYLLVVGTQCRSTCRSRDLRSQTLDLERIQLYMQREIYRQIYRTCNCRSSTQIYVVSSQIQIQLGRSTMCTVREMMMKDREGQEASNDTLDSRDQIYRQSQLFLRFCAKND